MCSSIQLKPSINECLDVIKAASPMPFAFRAHGTIQITRRRKRAFRWRGEAVMNTAHNFHSIVLQRRQHFYWLRGIDHCKNCLPCNVIHCFCLGSFGLVSDSAPPLEGASLVLEGHACKLPSPGQSWNWVRSGLSVTTVARGSKRPEISQIPSISAVPGGHRPADPW